ncbi:hypothetical protein GX865_04200 [Candidatus Saccharibacteria bacterium]|jgi:hypothetical protein|nr:hypothetical protein [Candidatus Saccharibacteria bacterium]
MGLISVIKTRAVRIGVSSLLFAFIFQFTFINEGALAQSQSVLDASKFFCDTRYGKTITGDESSLKSACQDGYDGKGCGSFSDDETKKACEAGARADKIPEEPDVTDESPFEGFNPPDLSSVSIAGKPRCGLVDTAYLRCPSISGQGVDGSPLWALLTIVLNVGIVMVGVVSVGAIVYAGIIYASANDDQSQLAKSKTVIKNTFIGLIVFAVMYSMLQFIIPGGIF